MPRTKKCAGASHLECWVLSSASHAWLATWLPMRFIMPSTASSHTLTSRVKLRTWGPRTHVRTSPQAIKGFVIRRIMAEQDMTQGDMTQRM